MDCCEELIKRISDILETQPIDEIGIIFDASLPMVFYEDRKLGISKLVVRDVFKRCLQVMYNDDRTASSHDLVRATRVLLIIKGDFPIVYNCRKKLLDDNYISLNEEIPFLALIFQNHPKSPSGWQHRRWCICRSKFDVSSRSLSLSELETERELCRAMCERYPKNYYAWTHRLWLLQFMSNEQLMEELLFTEGWLYAHVSDHSAANHRIQVAHHILKSCPSTKEYIFNYCLREAYLEPSSISMHKENRDGLDHFFLSRFPVVFIGYLLYVSYCLITGRPGHESLWYHRRSLFEVLMHVVSHSAVDTYPLPEGDCLTDEIDMQLSADRGDGDSRDERKCIMKAAYQELFHQLAGVLEGGGPIHRWLYSFIQSELQLAHRCTVDESVWSFEEQRLNAIKYATFVLDRLLRGSGACHKLYQRQVHEFESMRLHWNSMLIVSGRVASCRCKEVDYFCTIILLIIISSF